MSIKKFVKRNGTTILTFMGVTGVVITAVSATRRTPRALELIEEAEYKKGEELTTVETVIAAAPAYIPTIIFGAATITCILGANVLNKRRQDALMAAYVALDSSFSQYRQKVRDICGPELENQVEMSLLDKSTDEKMLFQLEETGQFFESTMFDVQNAEYHFNRNFILRGYACVNELLEFMGLDFIDYGEDKGWYQGWGFTNYGYAWVDFYHEEKELEDGTKYIEITMPFGPVDGYDEW